MDHAATEQVAPDLGAAQTGTTQGPAKPAAPRLPAVPIAKLNVSFAGMGDITDARGPRDPVVIFLEGVHPDLESLQILNRSESPSASWEGPKWGYASHRQGEDARTVEEWDRGRPEGHAISIAKEYLKPVNGKLALVMSEYEARRMKLQPGDALEIRQTFQPKFRNMPVGPYTTGTPTALQLDGRSRGLKVDGYGLAQLGMGTNALEPNRYYQFTARRDSRPPTLPSAAQAFEVGANSEGIARITQRVPLDPSLTIKVRNLDTGAEAEAEVNEDGTVGLAIDVHDTERLGFSASDGRNVVDLGILVAGQAPVDGKQSYLLRFTAL